MGGRQRPGARHLRSDSGGHCDREGVRTMGRVAAIAAERSVRGFGLAGALVFAAEDAEEIWSAWRDPPDDVDVVVLSAVVAGILGPPATTVQRPPTAVFARMTGIPDALAPVRS